MSSIRLGMASSPLLVVVALAVALSGTAVPAASARTVDAAPRLTVTDPCDEMGAAGSFPKVRAVAIAANPVNYVELDGHMVAEVGGSGGGLGDLCKLSPGTVYCFSLVEGVKAGDPWAEAIVLGAPGVAKGAAVVVVKAGAKPAAKAVVGNAQRATSGARGLFCKVFCKEAAKAGDDALRTVTALTREQDAALAAATRDANRLRHIFGRPEHNLGPLTRELGGQEALMREAVLAVPRGTTGNFEVTKRIGRYNLTVRGRIVKGVPRIGTVFVP